MGKYTPLSDHLAGRPGEEWRASFAELEEVLGFPLPKGARTGRTWWTNAEDRPHSRAWVDQGWEVLEVDHGAGWVAFHRSAAAPLAMEPAVPREVWPPGMLEATKTASPRKSLKPWGLAAAAGSVALVAGLGALAVRAVMRRRR